MLAFWVLLLTNIPACGSRDAETCWIKSPLYTLKYQIPATKAFPNDGSVINLEFPLLPLCSRKASGGRGEPRGGGKDPWQVLCS